MDDSIEVLDMIFESQNEELIKFLAHRLNIPFDVLKRKYHVPQLWSPIVYVQHQS